MAKIDLATFCRRLPKLELHAHLNGSLSPMTLKKLYELQFFSHGEDNDEWNEELRRFGDFEKQNSLEEYDAKSDSIMCFKMFPIAQKLTSSPEYVRIAAEDVIKEFHQDNVIYLELRSTPRMIEGKMSKQEYVEAIIQAINSCEAKYPDIVVKLLVSVDRKKGFEDAKENIDLAIKLHEKYAKYIVGIDLSGDPTSGDAFVDLMDNCRRAGLKISAHCAEVPNPAEIRDILNFKPDRLGHCTCIHPNLKGSEELFEMLLKSKLPVELCPTSNVKCGTVPNYESHQFKYLHEAGHPISISTDDKGVFATSLSNEYECVGRYLGVETDELRKISQSTILYCFASRQEKEKLMNSFASMVEDL